MARIASESKVSLVYKTMRENISSGLWKEGDQYSSFEVAKKYGIGRTTVNDAIKHLEKKGFIDILPNVGFRVKRIDMAIITDYVEVSLALEKMLVDRLILLAADLDYCKLESQLELMQASYQLGQEEVTLQALENYYLSLTKILSQTYVVQILWETEDINFYVVSQIMAFAEEKIEDLLACEKEFLLGLKEGKKEICLESLEKKKAVIFQAMGDIHKRKEAGREETL